ncbi:MAG TPA: DUF1326 domain-containing protein [Pirellula sp.]|nr:DUF1326 domain-containing protein [Pirellula sp.]
MQRLKLLYTSVLLLTVTPLLAADPVRGTYIEARTCQVYTGPCFANGEVGSVGKDAVLAWRFTEGSLHGVSLAGQSVAVVVNASETLGFNGFNDAKTKSALLIIDATADSEQAATLETFALNQTGLSAEQVAGIQRAKIALEFNSYDLTAGLTVGNFVKLSARKARPNDCICSNESAYYPPLTKLKGFVPGVTIEGEVTARKLSTRWSIPDTRTAYLGTFEINSLDMKLANKL